MLRNDFSAATKDELRLLKSNLSTNEYVYCVSSSIPLLLGKVRIVGIVNSIVNRVVIVFDPEFDIVKAYQAVNRYVAEKEMKWP
jgi:hypothetical protein